MNNSHLISVAMGIYNCKSTLKEAVDCIINQTYTNWELIMCDDASTDGTYEYALELSKKDSRIKVIRNEKNLTLAPTLNNCIKNAKGDFIARMDGDDICPPDRFEKELSFLLSNESYALVSVWMNIYDKDGIFNTIKYPKEPKAEDFIKTSMFCHAGCMVRKEALDTVGGYDETEKYKRVEDYDLWVRLYKAGYKGYNLQEALYSMRDDRNATKRRTLQNRLNEMRVKRKVIRYFKCPITSYVQVIIPLVKWLIPDFVYKLAHRNKST